ncbi:hypothetical protein [Pseudohongiella acticola]|jgi:hypothetical protein|uniref:hypothetical protein n=1 Tax=Pseudohongiella acticola TaxID=1524254 RepID=UPI0030EEBD04|tara:strand:- start:12 stop:704 length:693 start_codon:yes stop_codon:yes gene_type:complete
MNINGHGILYYPHIPKSLDRYFRATFPKKYKDAAYTLHVRAGDTVSKGDCIATYGYNKITAPCSGEILHLGGAPGLIEWPAARSEDIGVSCREDASSYAKNNINHGAIVFPEGSNMDECYSFSIKPLDFDPEEHYPVSEAFDNAEVWHDGKDPGVFKTLGRRFGLVGDTIYTTIDLLVYDLKSPGSGTKLPASLANDSECKKHLFRYWELINNGGAAKEILPNYEVRGPS